MEVSTLVTIVFVAGMLTTTGILVFSLNFCNYVGRYENTLCGWIKLPNKSRAIKVKMAIGGAMVISGMVMIAIAKYTYDLNFII